MRYWLILLSVMLIAACTPAAPAAPTELPTDVSMLPLDTLMPSETALLPETALPLEATPTLAILPTLDDAPTLEGIGGPIMATTIAQNTSVPAPVTATTVRPAPSATLVPTDAVSTPTPDVLTPTAQTAPIEATVDDAQMPFAGISLTPSVAPEDVVLTETFSGDDFVGGTVTVGYPATWVVSGDANALMLVNDVALLNAPETDLSGSQSAVSVSVIPYGLAPLSVPDGLEPSAPLVLAAYVDEALTTTDATFGQIYLITLGGRSAAVVFATNENDDSMIISVDTGTAYALIVGAADQGGLPANQPEILAIAGSVNYTP